MEPEPDPATTLRVYAHVGLEAQRLAADALDAVISHLTATRGLRWCTLSANHGLSLLKRQGCHRRGQTRADIGLIVWDQEVGGSEPPTPTSL